MPGRKERCGTVAGWLMLCFGRWVGGGDMSNIAWLEAINFH